jgi:hypothetical protein
MFCTFSLLFFPLVKEFTDLLKKGDLRKILNKLPLYAYLSLQWKK